MKLFKKVVDVLIRMMVPLVILALMLGMARIFLDLKGVFLSLKKHRNLTLVKYDCDFQLVACSRKE